ncbi:major histocompatibility complex class I-related gene protein-like isoform X2 [Amphiprion ocellaris]|uniref:major histocompatibility complex class I-related gene protein-like isoform X2 n=1 Tax=Amphiprion ocellaris TaxID=80972 RepID=UPI000C311509|nr:major histocompatibility complex class I-related gene protein-like isoform X2 [Amphiprion ocellaris]XP_054869305.1 major histocompatibility complex class I-related gene protein-like isoform X2 [Amphiprion ocellaris]
MKTLILMLLLGTGRVTAAIHSIKYFYTASSGIPSFHEFVGFGEVDDVQMIYFDSSTSTAVPRQDWVKEFLADNPEFWQLQTERFMYYKHLFKYEIETAKQRFNQTGGVYIFQKLYGCEWDDETSEINGFDQYGFDGEDWISLDLKTGTWVATKPQAVFIKHKWNNDQFRMSDFKYYHSQYCPERLKNYVNYGRSSLMRKELPSVSLLQKTPSSPVTCLATGFYPHRADLFWRKNGEELHEDVDKGEILPNHDGTFQMSVDLNISSIAPEDWEKYDCVFQLSGVKDVLVTKLDKRKILSNKGSSGFPVAAVGVIGGLFVLAVCITAVLICRRKYND